MSYRPADPQVQKYEELAQDAEQSPVPLFLKIGRVLVWIVYAIVLVNAILLTLAFFLRLFGANPNAGFVEWVYRSVDRAMEPFRGIFPTHEISDTSVLDFSLLFAAIVYFIVALLIDLLLRWLTSRLGAQQFQTARLREQADFVAQQAAVDQSAANQAAQEAAAREYAAQQAVANQYAIAQAAAREVLAQHAAQFPTSTSKAKPVSSPVGDIEREPTVASEATQS